MFRLAHVSPEEAQGRVKECYDVFPPELGVPEPLQLSSVSPEILAGQIAGMKYFMHHPRLEFPVLAAIRLIAARALCYDYCVGLNSGLLRQAGMTEENVEALMGGMEGVPFGEDEKTLLRLVRKVVTDPAGVARADVEACRKAGWSEADIYDASYHGAMMAVPARLWAAFRE